MSAAGVSVPAVEGIFGVEINWFGNLFGFLPRVKPGLVMERIYGKEVSEMMRTDLWPRVERLYAEECRKARAAGIELEDHYNRGGSTGEFSNGVYVAEEDRVVLVDMMKVRLPRNT